MKNHGYEAFPLIPHANFSESFLQDMSANKAVMSYIRAKESRGAARVLFAEDFVLDKPKFACLNQVIILQTSVRQIP